MSKKSNYQDTKNFIEVESNSGCKLKDESQIEIYKNGKSKIVVTCKCGTDFTTNFEKFKHRNKRQCNECGYKITSNKLSMPFEEIEEFVNNNSSCKIRTNKNEYIDIENLIEMTCRCGEDFKTTFRLFKYHNKRQCDKCGIDNFSKLRRNNIKDIVKYIKSYNYNIIRFLEKYKNGKSEFIMMCDKGHKYKSNYSAFKSNGSRCPYCSGNARLDGEFVYNEFLNNNLYPKFIPSDYKNNNTSLPYICPKHKEIGIQYKSYSALKLSNGCRVCGIENSSETRRLSSKYVYDLIKEKGLTPLESDTEYINNRTHIKCICMKHPDKIQNIRMDTLQTNKYGCKYCRYEDQSGENNYGWKGGFSSSKNFLRDKILQWKKDSIINSNFKCVLTGQIFDKIHHLYGFNLIIKEAFKETKIPVKKFIEYTNEDMTILSDKVIELHNKYPLGVCLKEELHKLFHILYKCGDNTPEQFEEFKIRLKDGEFNDLLNENGLILNY